MQNGATLTSAPANEKPPRLLDQVRSAARQHGHTAEVASAIADWCERFIRFHGKRHHRELDIGAAGQFLESVAQTEKDPVRSLAASRAALEFLYHQVLHIDLGELPMPRPPRLLDQVRQVLRLRHYSLRTEKCYGQWIVRFIRFHNKRHPRDMGAAEVAQFLSDLAVHGRVAASTQNQGVTRGAWSVERKGRSLSSRPTPHAPRQPGLASPLDLLGHITEAECQVAVGATRARCS